MKLPHIYGVADPKSDQPPTEQGLRGERSGPRTPVKPPHEFTGADGRKIAVQETSGLAGVEAVEGDGGNSTNES